MASKKYIIDGIGEITVYKRRGSRRMNLRIVGNQIRVTQPLWLPYAAGVQFAQGNQVWVQQQRQKLPTQAVEHGMAIGKERTLVFESAPALRTRITTTHIIVYVPHGSTTDSEAVQRAAIAAIKRALKKEAEATLPKRLAYAAEKYDFSYRTVHCKSMRTRWGSCNSSKEITLNIFLMMVPWELIDYVLIHELAHTKHMHHGDDFWSEVAAVVPDYKERRKQLKIIQHLIAHLQ